MAKLTELNDIDTFEFLNKTEELKELYNKFPNDVKEKYNNVNKFSREYLPNWIKEKQQQLEEEKKQKIELEKNENKEEVINNLQNQIKELKEQIGGKEENV